jgi:hypothetical protein
MSSLERDAVTHALRTAPNITEAARQLGSSRRTLQNRMRHYQIPPGKSGRPRELLPYRSTHVSLGGLLTLAAIAGGAFLTGRWLQRQASSNNPYLVGADILGA